MITILDASLLCLILGLGTVAAYVGIKQSLDVY